MAMSTLRDFVPADVFIETGYGLGATLHGATKQDYDEIHSIELDPDVASHAREYWAHRDGRVRIHTGDSRLVLPRIIDGAKYTFFWLDAHWSGGMWPGDATPGDTQCPLLDELEVIMHTDWDKWPHIYIDDAPLFEKDGIFWRMKSSVSFVPEQWPTLRQVIAKLSGYEVDIVSEVLIAIPAAAQSPSPTDDHRAP